MCPDRWYSATVGDRNSCKICEAGWQQVARGQPCVKCAEGYYDDLSEGLNSCRQCPKGYTSLPGSVFASCFPTEYDPPPPTLWQRISGIVIPILSVSGALFTYAFVGDTLFSVLFPVTHNRFWQRLALFLTATVAPALACCCCCCRARASAATLALAARIVTRLAEMEKTRRKNSVSRRNLARSVALEGLEGGASPVMRVNYVLGRGSMRDTIRGDRKEQQGAEEPAQLPPGWERVEDADAHWYVNRTTGEAVWALPRAEADKASVHVEADKEGEKK